MIVFPNCKINLGLHILNKRDDGYHNLETIFYPVAVKDALEIIQHPSPTEAIDFTLSGLGVDGLSTENSCVKAYHLLKKNYPQLPAVKMQLHKCIPMGAGLGGGSADGAFTLLLLNKKFNLQLTETELLSYALQLGSDCPFFIKNEPCYASGRGEDLEPLTVDLSAYQIVVVNPGIHINTGWAFSQIRPLANRPSVKDAVQQPVGEWKQLLTNDFEAAVFPQYPAIEQCKEKLYEAGAVYAAMTGSGATVYGLFSKGTAPALSFPAPYFVATVPA